MSSSFGCSPFVEFDRVSFSYGRRLLLDEISLSIPAGQLTAVLGPNGTGKTTFIHLAMGWFSPEAGTIYLKGNDIKSFTSKKRGRTMSLLPQSEPPSFEYTVVEYILLARAPHLGALEGPGKKDIRIAENSLKTTGISRFRDKPIPTLSGGETQLMLLSRSLTQQPEALVLDEPTNHLDLKNKCQIIDLLKEWKAEGKTALLTTHDPEIAAILADYLLLFSCDGEITSGPFKEVFTESNLSKVYGIPIEIDASNGRHQISWYH